MERDQVLESHWRNLYTLGSRRYKFKSFVSYLKFGFSLCHWVVYLE